MPGGRETVDGQGLIEAVERPHENVSDRIVGAVRQRTLDVLRLPAIAVWGDDETAGDAIRRRRAEVGPYAVKAGVQPRGRARRRDDIAVVDVEDRLIDAQARVELGEEVERVPMGDDTATGEQPRLGEGECPQAQPHDSRPVVVLPREQSTKSGGRRASVVMP